MQKNIYDACNFERTVLEESSRPRGLATKWVMKFRNKLFTLKGRISYFFLRRTALRVNDLSASEKQLFEVGEWVEVRQKREIVDTLDEHGKCKGLYFMPEMEEYCGKRFKIIKKAEKIRLESTGELRNLRTPSYFLDGVYCNGHFQGGCDRLCFHYWRAVWLKRID